MKESMTTIEEAVGQWACDNIEEVLKDFTPQLMCYPCDGETPLPVIEIIDANGDAAYTIYFGNIIQDLIEDTNRNNAEEDEILTDIMIGFQHCVDAISKELIRRQKLLKRKKRHSDSKEEQCS